MSVTISTQFYTIRKFGYSSKYVQYSPVQFFTDLMQKTQNKTLADTVLPGCDNKKIMVLHASKLNENVYLLSLLESGGNTYITVDQNSVAANAELKDHKTGKSVEIVTPHYYLMSDNGFATISINEFNYKTSSKPLKEYVIGFLSTASSVIELKEKEGGFTPQFVGCPDKVKPEFTFTKKRDRSFMEDLVKEVANGTIRRITYSRQFKFKVDEDRECVGEFFSRILSALHFTGTDSINRKGSKSMSITIEHVPTMEDLKGYVSDLQQNGNYDMGLVGERKTYWLQRMNVTKETEINVTLDPDSNCIQIKSLVKALQDNLGDFPI